MTYVQAANYDEGGNLPVRLVVMHTMESPEGARTAENVASWFAGGDAPEASAHYCVDSDSVVQCVNENDVAWHCGYNARSIGVEMAGTAGQTAEQWRDPYSTALLEQAAQLVAGICGRRGIPAVHLTDAECGAGGAGIVGHDTMSRVYRKSDHTDPGPEFPWAYFMGRVRFYSGGQRRAAAVAAVKGFAVTADPNHFTDQLAYNLQGWLNAQDEGKYADIPLDGVFGTESVRKLQWLIGAPLSGELDVATFHRWTRFVGVPAADTWTVDLIRAVETSMNAWVAAKDQATVTVVKGDTLWSISRKFGVSVDQLRKLNALSSDTISVGTVLKVK